MKTCTKMQTMFSTVVFKIKILSSRVGDIAVCTYHEPQVKKCGIKRKKTNLHFQTNIVIHLLFISKEEQINEHSQSNRYVFANYKKEVVNYSCTQPSMSGWVSVIRNER